MKKKRKKRGPYKSRLLDKIQKEKDKRGHREVSIEYADEVL